MKLINLVEHLLNPEKLSQLYEQEELNTASEALLIYMEGQLHIESEIHFFEIEETNDLQVFEKDTITYIQLFPLDYTMELVESDLDLKGKGYSYLHIADRLLEYRLKDA